MTLESAAPASWTRQDGRMRPITPIIALAVLALATPATPATALEPTQVTISDFQAANIVVTSSRCVRIPMSFRYAPADPTMTDLGWVDADLDVWFGDTNTGSADFGDENNTGTMTGDYQWCPWEGIGQFDLNNLTGEIDVYDASGNYRELSFTATGFTAAFTAKVGSRFTSTKVTKKGKTRTFTATASYFDAPGASRWTKFPKGGRVTLQRNDAGTWTNLKTAKTDKKGKVKITYKAATRATYRLYYGGSSMVGESTSTNLTK